VPLREAIALGLDLDLAIAAPEKGMIPWKSSQQVVISLRRFAQKLDTREASVRRLGAPVKGMALTPGGLRAALAEQDVGGLLGTEMRGEGMDKSLLGIAKRVAALVLALAAVGVALFYIGLAAMFPDGV
jgi:hypothetical protein